MKLHNKNSYLYQLPVALAVTLISACGGNSNNNTVTPIVTETVPQALVNFPSAVVEEFSENYPEITANEIFKSVSYENDGSKTISFGIEGVSSDELLEIDAVYTSDAMFIESSRGEVLDSLPTSIETAFVARYPDASIEEIESSTDADGTEYAVLFVQNDEEFEANFDDTGAFVSLENILEDDEIPDLILVTALAQNVDMPDVEYEEVTFADDSVSYVVEFENDEGESISYKIDSGGTVQQIDFEGPIFVTSSVSNVLLDFPSDIITDFDSFAPEVTANEIFKSINYETDLEGVVFYGIEGVSNDETLEIDAIYTEGSTRVESNRGAILDVLPSNIQEAFDSKYPDVSIEELASSTSDGVTDYAILFLQNEEELEANFDAMGNFISLEDIIEEEDAPSAVVETITAQNVFMPEVEYEEVTFADDSVSYVVEFENDDGESISYRIDADGIILQIDFEGPLD